MGSSAIGLAVNWVDWKRWFLLFSNRDLNPGSQFLSLLLLPLLLSLLQTASVDPSQEDQFYTALNQDAVLTVNFTSNSQCDVFWRKTSKAGNSSGKLVYNHMKNMSKGEFLGPYRTRAQYYSHNKTLVLNNVTEEDEGVYEVTQECADSAISTRMIRLSLMSPLSELLINVSVSNTLHSVLLTLSCNVTEGTQPSYWWLKDGKPLPRDDRHFEQNSSLEVRNVTEQDCVTYTCVSQNRLGSREAQRSITANDSPACISPGSAGSLTSAQILSIAAAVLCAAGLCIIVYCTKRHYQEIRTWFRGDRWRNPGNSMEQSSLDRGSRRESPYDMPEEELLNDENMQGAASAGDSVKVQYVYVDFLPNRGSSHRETEEEDNNGYSTINPRALQEGPDTRELNTDLEEQGDSEPWH
ncbi:junctional adhesion molecule C-like [Acipenser oxyrinchus oxyrinchus]|uniref:Junctional adhesion molecule C-like n=1 Tax=Acipenser oxyrinchus oxyrinchus TaxID=40147 RepID=A0AAD8FW20_ACIOX|nr:junctional adhesion molecule C-like [Acipenser oxyrinchus oxyrinchus]